MTELLAVTNDFELLRFYCMIRTPKFIDPSLLNDINILVITYF